MKISKKTQVFCLIGLLCVFGLTSCQEDEAPQTTIDPETLTANSPLTGLLERVAMLDTASDNIIDSTSCFQIDLPFQVHVNGQLVTVNSEADYDTVASFFGGTVTGYDTIEYVFPITIIYPDYSETVVSNQQQYDALLADCEASGDPIVNPIGCISLLYPITIFGYDSNFQLANTYTIDNDTELFGLLFNLSLVQYYAIDYPISVTKADGEVVVVNNNIELLGVIQTASNDCNPLDSCLNPQILTNDLIIYMPFANEARDLVSMNLAIHNDNYPPQLVADRDGNPNSALSFGGDGLDYLKLLATNANNIEPNDSLTISLWFRMQNTNPGNLEFLFQKSQETSVQNNNFGLAVFDLNTPLFFSGMSVFNVWDGSWNSDPQLPSDTANWHHLVVTIATETTTVGSVNVTKLYRDGVLRATGTGTNFFINTQVFDYYLGKDFTGYLDDLRVYRKTLTPQEVQTLYNLEGDNNTCLQ